MTDLKNIIEVSFPDDGVSVCAYCVFFPFFFLFFPFFLFFFFNFYFYFFIFIFYF